MAQVNLPILTILKGFFVATKTRRAKFQLFIGIQLLLLPQRSSTAFGFSFFIIKFTMHA
jgi:hypothetical protein